MFSLHALVGDLGRHRLPVDAVVELPFGPVFRLPHRLAGPVYHGIQQEGGELVPHGTSWRWVCFLALILAASSLLVISRDLVQKWPRG